MVELNLALQDLKILPKEFRELSELRNLDLSYNDFQAFPVQIFFVQNLIP